jgi:type I restriction enzyme S subunit
MEDVGKSIEIVRLNNQKLLSGLHTLLARQINNTFIIGFGGYLFKSDNIRAQIKRESQGAKVLGVSAGRLSNIKITFPANQQEQQKIAACLSSLDDLITAENQRLEALKTHKKGLMQSLFPAEGETVPKHRFPEFKDAAVWEGKPFKEIAKFLSGGTPSKDVPEYWEGTIPWISASSMHSTKIEKSDSNITFLAVSDGARMVDKGTLLLLVRGSMLHKRIPIGITETAVSFNQDVKAIVLKGDVSERYLMSFLIASESKLLAAVTATGIGAGKLDTNDLNDLLIKFPFLPEQQKIAACLSSLDDLINAQSQKIEALKQHKKGLMQQLFPTHNTLNAQQE